MDDPEDSTSESSETVIDNPGEDEAEKSANERRISSQVYRSQ
jgi:hypothetical protein